MNGSESLCEWCSKWSFPDTDLECFMLNPPIRADDLSLVHICANSTACYFTVSYDCVLDVYDERVLKVLLEAYNRNDSMTLRAHIDNIIGMWPYEMRYELSKLAATKNC